MRDPIDIFRDLIEKYDEIIFELRNLLAIIHGDGGHYTADVGLEQSVEDAKQVYYKLKQENEGLKQKIKELEDDTSWFL